MWTENGGGTAREVPIKLGYWKIRGLSNDGCYTRARIAARIPSPNMKVCGHIRNAVSRVGLGTAVAVIMSAEPQERRVRPMGYWKVRGVSNDRG